jgi:hypothetical protein
MVRCGLARKRWKALRSLVQTVCLVSDEKVVRGMEREFLLLVEWCKMLDTIGLCTLAMCSDTMSLSPGR